MSSNTLMPCHIILISCYEASSKAQAFPFLPANLLYSKNIQEIVLQQQKHPSQYDNNTYYITLLCIIYLNVYLHWWYTRKTKATCKQITSNYENRISLEIAIYIDSVAQSSRPSHNTGKSISILDARPSQIPRSYEKKSETKLKLD